MLVTCTLTQLLFLVGIIWFFSSIKLFQFFYGIYQTPLFCFPGVSTEEQGVNAEWLWLCLGCAAGEAAPAQQLWSLDRTWLFHFLANQHTLRCGTWPYWVKQKDTGSLFFMLLYTTSLYQFLPHFFLCLFIIGCLHGLSHKTISLWKKHPSIYCVYFLWWVLLWIYFI